MSDQNAVLLARLEKSVVKVSSAQSDRNQLIVEVTKANVPVQKVANAVGLSRARIYQIVAEQES